MLKEVGDGCLLAVNHLNDFLVAMGGGNHQSQAQVPSQQKRAG